MATPTDRPSRLNHATPPHSQNRDVPAFSLIELVMSMAVLATLLGLALSSLASIRAQRLAIGCIGNMRQTGLLMMNYGLDYNDYLPFAGYRARSVQLPSGDEITVGGTAGYRTGSWPVAFPEYWEADGSWSRSMMCPNQPRYTPGRWFRPGLEYFEHRPLPSYWLSRAFWMDPSSMVPPATKDEAWPPSRVRAGRWSDVLFPSRKLVLYELPAFCLVTPEQQEFIREYQQSYPWASTVFAADGSTRRILIDYTKTYPGETNNGVRGTDW